MGVSAAAVDLLIDLRQRHLLDDVRSVAEIGSQELHLSREQLERSLSAGGVNGYDRSKFPDIDNWPGRPRASARGLYELLGASEYTSFDLSGEDGAIAHDLNVPFDDHAHLGRYDLVTDHGSCEHVFDIAEAYRTVHRLARPGGLIAIVQQATGSNGYFNFRPSFFEDMAQANGYEILASSYIVSPAAAPEQQFHLPLWSLVDEVLDHRAVSSLGLAYVFRKHGDEDFKVGYEGGYGAAVYRHRGYALSYRSEPPSRSYLPIEDAAIQTIPSRELARELRRRIRNRLAG